MRRFLLILVIAAAVGLVLVGASTLAPATARAVPTATPDPLVWSGCKTCDVMQQRMQATAAAP